MTIKNSNCYCYFLIITLPLLATLQTARGQDHPMDLRELSLTELLSLDVVEVMAGEENTFFRGTWTVGYRYLFQDMKGYLDGRNRLSPESLLLSNGGPYKIVQGSMSQEMHVIEGSYSPTDRLTLLAGIPFISQTTAHQRVPGPNPFVGERFDITTSGLSDVTGKVAYTIIRANSYEIIGFGGVSFPTGSIDERGDVPVGSDHILPYTMQLAGRGPMT